MLTLSLDEMCDKPRRPSFILTYLCRTAINNAVLQKFNHKLGCDYNDIQLLSSLIRDDVPEALKIFDALRVCCPSDESGELLQTAVNEIVAYKSQLGILTDANGAPLYQYKFGVGVNGLTAFDKHEFAPVTLDFTTAVNRRIQEALFAEKANIIRNSLFSVESNAVHTLVSKLRLWQSAVSHFDATHAASFPHIEANIIYGDPLVSRFALSDDLLAGFKNIDAVYGDYCRTLQKLKCETNAVERSFTLSELQLLHERLIVGLGWDSTDVKELTALRSRISELEAPTLFALTAKETEQIKAKILRLQAKIKEKELQLNEFRRHPAFDEAVEWRYIFPEVLNESGVFTGFDAVCGFLPDALTVGVGAKAALYKRLNYKLFKRTGNIAELYCELSRRLLTGGGVVALAMRSDCIVNATDERLSDFFATEMNPLQIITFDELKQPDSAMNGQAVMIAQKDVNRHRVLFCRVGKKYSSDTQSLNDYVRLHSEPYINSVKGVSTAGTYILKSGEYLSINRKMNNCGLQLKNWEVKLFSGIKTGYDAAFIADAAVRDALLRSDPKTADVITPLLRTAVTHRYADVRPEEWLLFVPWHFPLHFDTSINAASERAENRFRAQYPELYNHLARYRTELTARNSIEVGLGFEWYALQRAGFDGGSDDFKQQKLLWKPDIETVNFTIDYTGCAVLEDMCYMTGQHLKYMLAWFNSTPGRYMLNDMATDFAGEAKATVRTIEAMSAPALDAKTEADVVSLVNRRMAENSKNEAQQQLTEQAIDAIFYHHLALTDDEVRFIIQLAGG